MVMPESLFPPRDSQSKPRPGSKKIKTVWLFNDDKQYRWALKAYMAGRGVMQGMSAANLSCEPADLSHLLRLIDAH